MKTPTCERCSKNAYRSYEHAVRALLIATRRTGAALRIYRCNYSSSFHLTKEKKKNGSA